MTDEEQELRDRQDLRRELYAQAQRVGHYVDQFSWVTDGNVVLPRVPKHNLPSFPYLKRRPKCEQKDTPGKSDK